MDVELGPQVPQMEEPSLSDVLQRLRLRAKDADLECETVHGVGELVGHFRDEDVGMLGVVADVDGDAVVAREILDVEVVGPDTDDLLRRRERGTISIEPRSSAHFERGAKGLTSTTVSQNLSSTISLTCTNALLALPPFLNAALFSSAVIFFASSRSPPTPAAANAVDSLSMNSAISLAYSISAGPPEAKRFVLRAVRRKALSAVGGEARSLARGKTRERPLGM